MFLSCFRVFVAAFVVGVPVHLSSDAHPARAEQVAPTQNTQSLQPLLAMAKHEQPETRLAAIAALGKVPQFRTDPATKRAAALALFAALDDLERSVRVAALL